MAQLIVLNTILQKMAISRRQAERLGLLNDPDFPEAIELTPGKRRWLESEIDAYIMRVARERRWQVSTEQRARMDKALGRA